MSPKAATKAATKPAKASPSIPLRTPRQELDRLRKFRRVPFTKLTVADVERQIEIPAPQWAGRCYEIATKAVEAGVFAHGARAVYGHFLGTVTPDSYFGQLNRADLGFQRHGWVVMPAPNNLLCDLTRWSFDRPWDDVKGINPKDLYLHIADPADEEYDEGGNRVRHAMRPPCPRWETKDDATVNLIGLNRTAWQLVAKILSLQTDYATHGRRLPGRISRAQMFWLANARYDAFDNMAPQIYRAIKDAGGEVYIPIDNLLKAKADPANKKGRGV